MKKIVFTLLTVMLSIFVLHALPDSTANIRLDSLMENYKAANCSVIQRMDVITAKVDSVHTQMKSESEKNWFGLNIDNANVWIAFFALAVGIFAYNIGVLAFGIGIAGTIYSALGYKASKRTAENVLRASFNVQKGQFDDLIRHLYRNLVCTLAFSYKLLEEGNTGGETYYVLYRKKTEHKEYPSEEHLLKLKVLPEDVLHLESYNQDYDIYQKMHELKLQLRNYDIEIDTAMTYLKDGTQGNAVIMGKLDALTFKPLFLISQIVGVVKSLDKKEAKKLKGKNIDEYQNAASVMTRSHVGNLIEHKESFKKNRYLDLNLQLPLEKTGKVNEDKEVVKEPYNGLARAYNLFFKKVIEADEKKAKPDEGHADKTTEDKNEDSIKDYVTHSERFKDKKPDDYKDAIEGICGKDEVKPNDKESTKKLKNFRKSITTKEEDEETKGNFPFKKHFLTMLSIDVTIELSKIHMIDINKPA